MKRTLPEELKPEFIGPRLRPVMPNRRHSIGEQVDDCTFGSLNARMHEFKEPAQNGHVDKHRNDFLRNPPVLYWSPAACHVRATVSRSIPECTAEVRGPHDSKQNEDAGDITTRPGFETSIPGPVAGPGSAVAKVPRAALSFGIQSKFTDISSRGLSPKFEYEVSDSRELAIAETEVDWTQKESRCDHTIEMFRQPKTDPITVNILIEQVREIYRDLVIAEKACIVLDGRHRMSRGELSNGQWQALLSAHSSLLYHHHDFLCASQHPVADPITKRLPGKYAIPARMWKYAIHSFLELMGLRLRGSLGYMTGFIHLAYSTVTLLLEHVAEFKDIWIECLGDLARYRMAIEGFHGADHRLWADISRYWYHHHAAAIGRTDSAAQVTSCNFAAMFHYGSTDGLIDCDFSPRDRPATEERRKLVAQWTSSAGPFDSTDGGISSQLMLRASSLASHILIAMLDQGVDEITDPSVHISMAFIWCLTFHPAAMHRVEPLVPWTRLVTYLNGLFQPDHFSNRTESERISKLDDEPVEQLPEDSLIRGQVWSRLYYPEVFFEEAASEEDRSTEEGPSTAISRRHRCLWLGMRMAAICHPFLLSLKKMRNRRLIIEDRWAVGCSLTGHTDSALPS
ncbi:unnamed protein product [Penicillium olsonii]|nr:unnamed protein product [Penicillium olsonii]CAG8183272.1 unnamed protein product [Penicillium olsonii]